MKRISLLVAAVVAVGLLAVGAAGALAQEEPDDGEIAPGEQLSGVVGVQDAEFEGELNDNAFAVALDRADDDAARASEIAARVNDTETRLAELEERRDRLKAQRENGEISEGEYRARTARLATEVDNAQRQLNRSDAAAAGINPETLRENGVNVDAIETLRRNASELSGGEVSEIARSIAGENRGPFRQAAGDRAGNATAGPDGRPADGPETGSDRRSDGADAGTDDDDSDGSEPGDADRNGSETPDPDSADVGDDGTDSGGDSGGGSSDTDGDSGEQSDTSGRSSTGAGR